jgi:uncharacterized alkaline shock family protein YloU
VTGPVPPVRVHVSDTAVARVAAHRALAVPGVLALQADLGQAMPAVAGSRLGSEVRRPHPAGAVAEVGDGTVAVALTVVTGLGHNCRELAQQVQRAVAAEIAGYTGLAATVTVTIAEIVLDQW